MSFWANTHELAQALIEVGASISVKGTDGKGLLLVAAMYADAKMCEILGCADTAGFNPYAKMKDGMNAWGKLRDMIGLDSGAGSGLDEANIGRKVKARDSELIELFSALVMSSENLVGPGEKIGAKRRDDGEEGSS